MKREWFLMLMDPNSEKAEECLAYKERPCEPMSSLSVHVIEYSAYEKLVGCLEDLLENHKYEPVLMDTEIRSIKNALGKK